MDMLHGFFAVTETSVYKVTDAKDEKGTPIVEKIALKGKSKILVGGRLHDGTKVIVANSGISLYSDSGAPEYDNIVYRGSKTSSVVALSLRETEARECFETPGSKERCDPRWRGQTNEVLDAIGDQHPVFVTSRDPSSAFPR
jgi:hypothetical protein